MRTRKRKKKVKYADVEEVMQLFTYYIENNYGESIKRQDAVEELSVALMVANYVKANKHE